MMTYRTAWQMSTQHACCKTNKTIIAIIIIITTELLITRIVDWNGTAWHCLQLACNLWHCINLLGLADQLNICIRRHLTGMRTHGSQLRCCASSHAEPCDIGRTHDARCTASRSSWPNYVTESRTQHYLCHIASNMTELATVSRKYGAITT